MNLKLFFFLCFLSNIYIINSQTYPGGVTGAEVWYIADWESLNSNEYPNFAQTDITINSCAEMYKNYLFNFNPSIYSDNLCLQYNAPLENSKGRNIFFVGESNARESSQSHLGTLWRNDIEDIDQTETIIRNFFDVNTKNVFTKEIFSDFSSLKNANVNFYHTNNYNIDKKFKSYGQEGETTFYIGSPTLIDPLESYEDNYFSGNFPEFIIYPEAISNNERQRIESYLALKYGLTLDSNTSYLSSKNIVFWNESNNQLFPNRIFGFGKDKVSSLNQLQSESSHLKRHLVSAIEEIMETNIDKQVSVKIPDNHFLVFGDNGGKTALIHKNNYGIKFWDKVWLAQRTGNEVEKFDINYKLFLTPELIETLIGDKDITLWLLQDKYIGNNEISHFDNNQIVYHKVADLNLERGYAYFKGINFDSDKSIYDQFTFGIGARMIAQVEVVGCVSDRIVATINITGGNAPYDISVESSRESFEDTTNETTYSFRAEPFVLYTVKVKDRNGIVSVTRIIPEPWGFELNLGPDQNLSATQPEIILNAGIGIEDPNATYQWYLDGVLLPDNEGLLIVTEAGIYDVVVTSKDLSCTVKDSVNISYDALEVILSYINGCDQLYNSLTINIEGGVPNFTTTLEGDYGIINYVHSGTTTINDIPYGSYIVTISDEVGQIYIETIDFIMPLFEVDLVSQINSFCSNCILYPGDAGYPSYGGLDIPFFNSNSNFTLDASQLISSTTATYQWFLNDILISEESTFSPTPSYCFNVHNKILRVEISDSLNNNCFASESLIYKSYCVYPIIESPIALSKTDNEIQTSLRTSIYPNPSEPNITFTYRVKGSVQFEAIVELFTITGAKLYHVEIQGNSTYTLPFSLNTAGMYLIKISSPLGVKTDKVIIK